MRKLILLISLVCLAGCATVDPYMQESVETGAAAVSYPQNASPARTDEALGIDAPTGTWSINRFPFSAILGLIEDADLPSTITRDTEVIGLVLANDGPGSGLDADTVDGLEASDLQGFAAWVSGRSYTVGVTGTIHGGVLYLCTGSHTAAAATEPGVGANWATVWEVHTGAGGGGDVAVSGTPVADQVGVWATAATLKGSDADDLVIVYSPTNYSATTAALSDHLTGIDAALSDADPLLVNNAPADHSVQGGLRIESIQAGEAIARFKLVYRKNDTAPRLFKYSAATAFTDNDTYMPVGMTTSAAAAAGDTINMVTGVFYLKSSDYTQTYSSLGSRPVYASTTAGDITLTAPSAAGDKVIIVGHLWGNDRYLMSLPAMVDVEIPAP